MKVSDQPLPLQRAGDETEVTLCGLRIKAIFVPGHSFDSMLYAMEFNGKRVLFTGDLGFEGVSNILHRCWGDREKALVVARVVRTQVLALKPDHVLTGHGPRPEGMAFLRAGKVTATFSVAWHLRKGAGSDLRRLFEWKRRARGSLG